MKQIEISYETFGELWKRAQDGDRTDDDVLRRVLGLSGALSLTPVTPGPLQNPHDGFYDARFDVKFPQGFRIFRSYKGKPYAARATSGRWHLEGHLTPYDSLNSLNIAVGAKTENAWMSWFYDDNGVRRPISNLRKPSTIKRRT